MIVQKIVPYGPNFRTERELELEYRGNVKNGVIKMFNTFMFGVVWNKLFRTRILRDNNIRFNEDIHFREDEVFVLAYCNKINKISVINEGGYHYMVPCMTHKYAMRYPENFNIYTKNNYPELKESQRDIIATYDNSIIYNDYVVSEIFNFFESKEALVLYFSDHGQDLFDSSENHFGHAIIGNSKSETAALKIPFLVYMSPSFQEKYPQTSDCIRDKKDEPFITSNTIDFLCNIMNVQYCTLDWEDFYTGKVA